MNRINQLFNSNKKDILSIYFCAGTPTLDGTADVIRTLEKHGVSMIEIGIPFSDPMADGIVIQNAATQALRNGMSLKLLFEQLRDIRKDVKIPLVFMGYLNTTFHAFAAEVCNSDLKTSAANAWNVVLMASSSPTSLSVIIKNITVSLPNATTSK